MGSTINHCPNSIPTLIAGGKGFIKTGYYLDYRGNSQSPFNRGYPGRPLNDLHVSLMKCFGLTAADWDPVNQSGFGDYTFSKYDGNYWTNYDFSTAKKNSGLPNLLV